jgi:transcriptional regulator with XRE-family HTH domain
VSSPTLANIAQKLGISKMTVSRALRGERHVQASLREKIVQTAAEIGYQPDPEIAKLMTHMRRVRQTAAPRMLAIIWAEREAEGIARSSWSQQLVLGAHRQAKKLGFQLEEFHLAARGMTARRLSSILEARGIPGFILSGVALGFPAGGRHRPTGECAGSGGGGSAGDAVSAKRARDSRGTENRDDGRPVAADAGLNLFCELGWL